MAARPLPPDLDAMVARANPAVIATVKPDGSPHSVATWYLWEKGRILVNMDDSRKRLAWMQPGARVALTVIAEDDFYTHVSFRGTVATLEPDVGLADIDRLSRAYAGRPYHDRLRPRTSAWIEIDNWHGWQGAPPKG
ncbi:MAG: PPOX class F420-dependent oxidoreductase [Actinobacteria bacterium]|nr:PPOX class F420-dependent oxidoreductase [Actinomycetota bacterium]